MTFQSKHTLLHSLRYLQLVFLINSSSQPCHSCSYSSIFLILSLSNSSSLFVSLFISLCLSPSLSLSLALSISSSNHLCLSVSHSLSLSSSHSLTFFPSLPLSISLTFTYTSTLAYLVVLSCRMKQIADVAHIPFCCCASLFVSKKIKISLKYDNECSYVRKYMIH